MNQIQTIVNAPKVFGHLYMAIFSNGTVKAGKSARDPKGRVSTHAHSGKAFDIHLDSAFYASICTDDVGARERAMHQELGLVARPTAGREWFKFESATDAVIFASAYLCKVERMSFAERPSVEALLANEKRRQQRAISTHNALTKAIFRFPPAFQSLSPLSEQEAKEMEMVIASHSPAVSIAMARKIMDHEDFLAQQNETYDSGLPLVADAVNIALDEALSMAADPNDLQSRCQAIGCISFESAVQIIKAAANYPVFFREALFCQEVAA